MEEGELAGGQYMVDHERIEPLHLEDPTIQTTNNARASKMSLKQNRAAIYCLLWIGAEATCGSQLTSSVDVDISSPTVIKKLWVDSLYPFSVGQGDKLSIQFVGTDAGQADWVVSDSEVTMAIMKTLSTPGTSGTPGTSSTPVKQQLSTSSRLAVPVAQLVTAVVGLAIFRFSTKGAVVALLLALCLSNINVVQMAEGDVTCPNVSVHITVPSGKVWSICDANNSSCVCGTDYTGPNCNFYKAKCIPTPEQIANRLNPTAPMPWADISLPEPGESFCDSNFGTEIWRVSNRIQYEDPDLKYWAGEEWQNTDQKVHILGSIGFSPNMKYVVAQTASASFAYEISIDEYNIPHINTTKRILLSYSQREGDAYGYLGVNIGNGGWMTDRHIVFTESDQVYMIDVEGPRSPRGGGMISYHIGNLTQFLVNDYYDVPLTDIQRCSLARIRPDGSLRMMCSIRYGVGNLVGERYVPDPNKIDSHSPNATCIASSWTPGQTSAQIGYIVFDVLSPTPADPQTNIKLYARFVNGLDSDEWYCFQSTLQWSHTTNSTRKWIVWNGQNNGYKGIIDRSGEWMASHQAIDLPATNGWSIGLQPSFKAKFRPYSAGGGFEHSVVHDYEGHGGYGWATAAMQCGAPGECEGWCLSFFNFTEIPDMDPGGAAGNGYLPTQVMLPNMDDGPWRYRNGMYGTYHHATPTNKGEAVMATGCDTSNINLPTGAYNCSEVPIGSEVIRVIPHPHGGQGVVERILTTRDGTWTQYSVITAPCKDDDGPCWVLFQSSWGVSRTTAQYNSVPSDIFIARFR